MQLPCVRLSLETACASGFTPAGSSHTWAAACVCYKLKDKGSKAGSTHGQLHVHRGDQHCWPRGTSM